VTTQQPSHLRFSEFAEAVQPSGAINRFPGIGASNDVYTYSVYMNGPLAQALPQHAREHHYKDVTLQALTEKLKLEPLSARDNLKVAELVSLRSAWMSAVLENSRGAAPLPAGIQEDYTLLSEGLGHPWIVGEIVRQRDLSAKLGPSLARAGVDRDVVPRALSMGPVVAQDDDFTQQRTQDGEVVTHENRRLATLPSVGDAVLVSYYRGAGQVVEALDKAVFSDPFIDRSSDELAVRVSKAGRAQEQTVLFSTVQSYEVFARAHGLSQQQVQKAFDVRAASPRATYQPLPRRAAGLPYLDQRSGCIALDYLEGDIGAAERGAYTVLFESAGAMASVAAHFGASARAVAEAHRIEDLAYEQKPGPWRAVAEEQAVRQSDLDIRRSLADLGYVLPEKAGKEDRYYAGPIVAVSARHVAQDIGRKKVVIHDVQSLDKVPAVGDRLNIRVKEGRGVVTDMVKAGKDLGR
jgi:hypothetical protein